MIVEVEPCAAEADEVSRPACLSLFAPSHQVRTRSERARGESLGAAAMTPSTVQAGLTNGHKINGKSQQHDAAQLGFSTRAIHVGSEPSEDTGALIPAISLSTTFKQHGVGGFKVSRMSVVELATQVHH